MKYISIFICILAILGVLVLGANSANQTNNEYLRIHIRANSNSAIDQNVKYQIRDSIIDALVPIIANCETKREATLAIQNNLEMIETVADEILRANNFSYVSHAKITSEEFPTRTYGDLTLESGFYDALILELGTGAGDNWWCIVYPPLCFVNASPEQTQFKSRLIEIINNFFN